MTLVINRLYWFGFYSRGYSNACLTQPSFHVNENYQNTLFSNRGEWWQSRETLVGWGKSRPGTIDLSSQSSFLGLQTLSDLWSLVHQLQSCLWMTWTDLPSAAPQLAGPMSLVSFLAIACGQTKTADMSLGWLRTIILYGSRSPKHESCCLNWSFP